MSKIIDSVKTLNNLVVEGTTQSSSSSTGALIVSGGVGIAKSANIGENLYVDNILATEYKDIQAQFINNTQSIGNDFGICTISNNGLWAYHAAPFSGLGEIYFRKNINDPFVFQTTLFRGALSSLSEDGKYLLAYEPNTTLRIYSRNTETNVWTLNFTASGNFIGAIMSSDGNYVFATGGGAVLQFRRTPGTNTWTLLGTMSVVSSGSVGIYGGRRFLDCSNNGDRVVATSKEGFTVFKKQTDTTWVNEQDNVGSLTQPGFGVGINDDGNLIIATINNIPTIFKRTGTVWNSVFTLPNGSIDNKISKDGSTIQSGDFIYKRVTDDNWKLITTIVTGLGFGTSGTRRAFDFNLDGSTFIIGASTVSGSYIYNIENEVSFDQKVKTKTINFNDTLKITSAYDAIDHLVTLPPFNQKGSLINDGVGNTTWSAPFNQSLNTGDAVQFDRIGISPNVGQITTSAQLQLSMRLINESYTGFCAQVRRDTTFTVSYLLDTELDDSPSLTGAATYTSTGGASSRGLFTATLVVSDTFTVDGTTLSSANNGTRILLIGQNVPSENGIWTTTITGTTLTLNRSTDYDADSEIVSTNSFKISLGTTYGNTGQLLTTTDSPIILGGVSGSDLTFSTIEITKDIGFNAGIIDISELSMLIGTNNGYVSIWYDQSGNNNDFVQAVEANQPRILMTGGINWLPTVSFDGVDDYLDAGDVLDISTSAGWYVNLVADTNVIGGAIISKSTDSLANRWGLSFNGGNFDVIYEDTVDSTVSTAQASGDPQIISLSIDRAVGTKTINSYIDNTIINTNISITNDNTYDFNSATSVLLGAIDNAGLTYATGFISEVVIHNFAPTTAERVGLEQDQSSFYDITIVNIPKVNLKISPNITVDYDLVLPASQGNNNELLVNDGAGNLAWGTAPLPDSITLTDTTQSVDTVTGALIVAGGIGVAKNVNIGENLDVLLTSTLRGVVSVTDTTESVDTVTGALVVTGGIGVAKKLNVGGILTVIDITQSSSSSTGALIVSGGVGIAKSANIGENLYVDNILATEYKDVQAQFINNTQSIGNTFGTCVISGNGLWVYHTAPFTGQGEIYFRKNINDPFVFQTTVIRGGYNSLSEDGKYLLAYLPNTTLRIYSRNTETNVWSLDFIGNGGANYNGWHGAAMSSDGNYIFGYSGTTVRQFRRTPGTNTWTLIGTMFPVTSGSVGISGANEYLDCSNNGDRVVASSREGFTVFKKQTATTWVNEQDNVGSLTNGGYGVGINDDGNLIIATIRPFAVTIFKRTGTVWNSVFILPFSADINKMSKDGSTVRSGDFIYKRVTDDNWKLITTFDATIAGFGVNTNTPAFDFNRDGSTFIIGGNTVSGSYVYDITNEVSFDQKVKTKTINFNDTLKITSAYDAIDHLVTLPPFNQKGSLINDGVGNTTWSTPYNQSLNTGDAVQFDRIGISPNVGQITTSAQLQLSMRLINESYTGFCAQVRRDTTFTVSYLLDTELDDSPSLTGAATYTSTGGASSRGLFTATLAVSDAFTVDGTTLSSANNGTRILLIGQNVPSENGIWTTTITGTTLTLNRSTDYDADSEIVSTDSFKISLGTTYGNTGQRLTTTDSPIILGGVSGSDLTFSTIVITKDIGFNAGIIDISELSMLIGTNNGYVSIWYDQSGNNNDFVQAVEANQPRILMTGGINWLPTVSFDGVDDYLDAGDVLDISTSAGWYINLVADTNVIGGAIISKSTDSLANRWGLSFNGGNFDVIYEDTVDSTVSTVQASGDPQIISLSIDRAVGTKTINSYINNTIINTNIPITNDNTYNFDSATSVLLGAIDNAGLTYATGFISEVVIHNFAPTTAERVGLEQDQSSFYDITIVNIPKVNLKISPNITVDYDLVLPASQGNNAEVLTNDGSGNLSWSSSGGFVPQSGFSVNSVDGSTVSGSVITWLDLASNPTYVFSSDFINTGTAFRPQFTYSGAGGYYQFQVQFIFRGNTTNDQLVFEIKKNDNTLSALVDTRRILGKDVNEDHNINVKWIFILAAGDFVSSVQYSMNAGAGGTIKNMFYSIKRLA